MQYILNRSKNLWVLSLAFLLYLLFFLVLQVNYFVQDVFMIRDCENTLNNLSDNRGTLEVGLAQSSSLNNIDQYLINENFKKANHVKYIQILEPSVAKTNERF